MEKPTPEQLNHLAAQPLPPEIEKIFSVSRSQFFAEQGEIFEKTIMPIRVMYSVLLKSLDELSKQNTDLKSKPTKNRAERRRESRVIKKQEKKQIKKKSKQQ